MKKTIPALLDRAVEMYPDKPYLKRKTDAGWKSLTFKESAHTALAFAAWLKNKGYKKADAFSLMAEGCPQWILSELGLTLAGLVSVPLSIKLLPEEIPFRLNHSGSKAFIVTKNTLEKAAGVLDKVENKDLLILFLDENVAEAEALLRKKGFQNRVQGFYPAVEEGRRLLDADSSLGAKIKAEVEEDDVVNICYTSGTTGNPKGIMLTNKNYYTNVDDAIDLFKIPVGFRLLVILPLDHSFAHTVAIYAGLWVAMELSFVDARTGNASIVRNIPINLKEVEPDMLLTVPAISGNFMKKIIAGVEEKGSFIAGIFHNGIKAGIKRFGNGYNKVPLSVKIATFFPYAIAKALIFKKVRTAVFGRNLQFCVGGGALLELKQQEFFNALGLPIYQGYGLTEATPIISANTPVRHKFGTSGSIFRSIELKIMDGGKVVPKGQKGEIVIRGGNVMKGYFKNPEQTAKTIIDNWLFTGDLAWVDNDDFLVVVGREKALLISADGEKYQPEEIEEAITASTSLIEQIMVYNDQRKYTSALIVLDSSELKKLAAGSTDANVVMKKVVAAFNNYKQNSKIPAQWCPSTFAIIEDPFTEANFMVNSTMKMVRHKVCEIHAAKIEYLYGPEGHRPDSPANLEALTRLLQK